MDKKPPVDERVRVIFQLNPDDQQGYETESMWAERVGQNEFRFLVLEVRGALQYPRRFWSPLSKPVESPSPPCYRRRGAMKTDRQIGSRKQSRPCVVCAGSSSNLLSHSRLHSKRKDFAWPPQ